MKKVAHLARYVIDVLFTTHLGAALKLTYFEEINMLWWFTVVLCVIAGVGITRLWKWWRYQRYIITNHKKFLEWYDQLENPFFEIIEDHCKTA